jgi:16S rRNA (uracil1498-N3)-methyltransferase
MKTHRFFTKLERGRDRAVSFVDRDTIHQIVAVLKLHAGEVMTVLDGKGNEIDVELDEVGKQVSGHMIDERKNLAEPKHEIVLYAAILKRENFEWAVQKAVECGVTSIVPVLTDRTIKKDVNIERLQAIAKEAAEQSGRGIIPVVEAPMKLDAALKHAKGEKYFFDIGGETLASGSGDASLFIGPEGGWTDEERAKAKRAGAKIVSLGPRVLRGETAAAVAMYLFTQ